MSNQTISQANDNSWPTTEIEKTTTKLIFAPHGSNQMVAPSPQDFPGNEFSNETINGKNLEVDYAAPNGSGTSNKRVTLRWDTGSRKRSESSGTAMLRLKGRG
jgi:hypothetical protein